MKPFEDSIYLVLSTFYNPETNFKAPGWCIFILDICKVVRAALFHSREPVKEVRNMKTQYGGLPRFHLEKIEKLFDFTWRLQKLCGRKLLHSPYDGPRCWSWWSHPAAAPPAPKHILLFSPFVFAFLWSMLYIPLLNILQDFLIILE